MSPQQDAAALVQELQTVFSTGRTRSVEWRLQQLNGLVRFADERGEEIADALMQDLGRPRRDAYQYEVDIIRNTAASAAAKLKEWMQPEKVPSTIPELSNSAIIPEPLGVALVISSWNFPFVLCFEPLVGAVAAGNAAVVKPSKLAPASAAVVTKYLPLYLDPIAIRVFETPTVEAATAIIDQNWDKIFYTGGPKVGRLILGLAAKHLTPVTLEMGGKSPTIVDSTADLPVTAKRIIKGKWGTNYGQLCLAPDYILAEESIVSELIKTLKDTLVQFYGEDAQASPDLGRVINVAQFHRLCGLLDDEKIADIIVHGGERHEKSLYVAPTLILNPPQDSVLMQDEIFGPILAIISVKNVKEAINFVNSRPKPLALYVFTSDQKTVDDVMLETSSGGVTVNDIMAHTKHEGLPFGGVGESGLGRCRGKFSFETFSHYKAVTYRDFTGDVDSAYPPFNKV